MYIPREQAGLRDARIIRALCRKYPDLNVGINVITRTTFTDDPPNHPVGKRSRVGDCIILLDGEDFYMQLRKYPEDFKFQLSQGFSVTLKGGICGDQTSINLATNFASKIILGSQAEAMRQAQAANSAPP